MRIHPWKRKIIIQTIIFRFYRVWYHATFNPPFLVPCLFCCCLFFLPQGSKKTTRRLKGGKGHQWHPPTTTTTSQSSRSVRRLIWQSLWKWAIAWVFWRILYPWAALQLMLYHSIFGADEWGWMRILGVFGSWLGLVGKEVWFTSLRKKQRICRVSLWGFLQFNPATMFELQSQNTNPTESAPRVVYIPYEQFWTMIYLLYYSCQLMQDFHPLWYSIFWVIFSF